LEELSAAVGSPFADAGRAFVTPRTAGAATVVSEYLSGSGPGFEVDADVIGSQADICQWVSQDRLQVVDLMIMSSAAYDAIFTAVQDTAGFEETSGAGDGAYKLNDHAHAVQGDLSVLVVFSTSEDPGAVVAMELLRAALARI
jgi:hypothetical protein